MMATKPGNKAAIRLAATLGADGIKCFRVKFPKHLDANLFAQKSENPQDALQSLLNSAEFMGSMLDMPTPQVPVTGTQGSAQNPATQGSAPNPAQGSTSLKNPEIINSGNAGNSESQPPQNIISGGAGGPPPAGSGQSPGKAVQSPGIPCVLKGEDIFITLGERQYRVRGLDNNSSHDVLKVNIRAFNAQTWPASRDFLRGYPRPYSTLRHRKSFMHSVADELKLEVDIVKRDIGKLLLKLEELQEGSLLKLLEEEKEPVKVLTPEEEDRCPRTAARSKLDQTHYKGRPQMRSSWRRHQCPRCLFSSYFPAKPTIH